MNRIVNQLDVLRKLCELMDIKTENNKLTFKCPMYITVDVYEQKEVDCDCITSFHTVCTKCNGTKKTHTNYKCRKMLRVSSVEVDKTFERIYIRLYTVHFNFEIILPDHNKKTENDVNVVCSFFEKQIEVNISNPSIKRKTTVIDSKEIECICGGKYKDTQYTCVICNNKPIYELTKSTKYLSYTNHISFYRNVDFVKGIFNTQKVNYYYNKNYGLVDINPELVAYVGDRHTNDSKMTIRYEINCIDDAVSLDRDIKFPITKEKIYSCVLSDTEFIVSSAVEMIEDLTTSDLEYFRDKQFYVEFFINDTLTNKIYLDYKDFYGLEYDDKTLCDKIARMLLK